MGGENWRGETHKIIRNTAAFFWEQHGWMVDIITYQFYWNEDVFVGHIRAFQNFQKGLERTIGIDISPFWATKNLQVTSWDFTILSTDSKHCRVHVVVTP